MDTLYTSAYYKHTRLVGIKHTNNTTHTLTIIRHFTHYTQCPGITHNTQALHSTLRHYTHAYNHFTWALHPIYTTPKELNTFSKVLHIIHTSPRHYLTQALQKLYPGFKSIHFHQGIPHFIPEISVPKF